MCSLRHCLYNLCTSLCSSGKSHIAVQIRLCKRLEEPVTRPASRNLDKKMQQRWRPQLILIWVKPTESDLIHPLKIKSETHCHLVPFLKRPGWKPAWEDPGHQYLQPGRVRAGSSWIKLSSVRPRCFQTSPGGTAGDSCFSSGGLRQSGSYWRPLWGSNDNRNQVCAL